MQKRTLRMTAPTHTVLEGGGFPVRRPSAMGSLMSPFLLLDEMGPVHWEPGQAIGAPAHPHRGFETVTYMIQGAMKHEDSAGNKGDLNPGDVQWMTAGRGIIHSELPQDDFLKQGGVSHGFQIWVNLPSKDKMMQPRYQEISSKQIPKVTSEDGKVWANIIAGSTLGVQAVIDTVIPITYIHMKIQKQGAHCQAIEQGLNGMIYVFGGTVHIEGKPVHDGQLGLLTDGDEVIFEAQEDDAEFLILAGPELNEPIARYGPFVMNNREEIQQALLDYQNGNLA
ncbi:MAG: pirin family protein [Euryarchaeota archaeon]|nr:pirin family protein [Euryarchaeota archaeon]MBT5595520.1 pirin family protein [Euryarchaeota archaeon]MBT5844691.1 pirin family protein [Euryarchaeota archaeon]MBT6640082.1 pirin family protein [Euryarchaeota archaeon]MBT6845729.1 pirin family protein [Euryarchaeota archaeon]